ncbi:hypothetical protein pdam_00016760 [Pocillopora damicornis]|uniref:Diaminopimelate decarboxylase n=1 Tax=Pocillopora damicornis TaxID=46731 RepID=A0A3M6TBP1_POCDA|nr:uncharacterized protein LOC113679840 [Pocillopora damicornis]RMX38805.1 hypothetical protein pdam_00016760 [Pocillopora damicornis]
MENFSNALKHLRKKPLPCNEPELRKVASQFVTPFYLYDKQKIITGAKHFNDSFAWVQSLTGSSFRNHFAVKATPTPKIMKMLYEDCGMGMDCSSLTELLLCEKLGIKGEDIIFTSNNTPFKAYRKAFDMEAIVNLDDFSQIDNMKKALAGKMPNVISFRYNPGPYQNITHNLFIGDPVESKYGMTKSQLFSAYKKCREYGVTRFGLHTMLMSDSLNILDLAEVARMMFSLAVEIKRETGIAVEFVDLGGGMGVNYRPEDEPIDLGDLGQQVKRLYEEIVLPHTDLHPLQIKYECGTLVTVDCGWLVSRVINMKDTYKRFLGVDASMADLMGPSVFGMYNHITIVKDQAIPNHLREDLPDYKTVVNNPSYACPNYEGNKREKMFDVVGSLCINIDKFAIDRELNEHPEIGDLCIIHSAGAYGRSESFNFNGKLRHAEILRVAENCFEVICDAETCENYFALLKFPEECIHL